VVNAHFIILILIRAYRMKHLAFYKCSLLLTVKVYHVMCRKQRSWRWVRF